MKNAAQKVLLVLMLWTFSTLSAYAEVWRYGVNGGQALTGSNTLTSASPSFNVVDGATITLPLSSTCKGKPFIFSSTTGTTSTINAAGGDGPIILPSGSGSSFTLTTAGATQSIISTGTGWVVFSATGGGGGGGTVTSVAASTDGVLLNATVTGSPITTGAGSLTFTTKNAPATTLLSNFTASSALPAYNAPTSAGDIPLLRTDGTMGFFNHSSSGANADPIQQSKCQKWCAARSKVQAATASANIFVVGDSETEGGTQATVPQRWTNVLTTLLNTYEVPAAEGTIFATDPALNETRITYGTGWAYSALVGGAGANAAAGAAGAATWTPGYSSDTVTVLYARQTSGGSVVCKLDGSSTLGTINTAGTVGTIGTQTFTYAAGVHTIVFDTVTTNSVYIVGCWFQTSTAPKVYVHNAAVKNYLGSSWNTASNWNGPAYMAAIAPNLSIFCLGAYDAAGSVTASAFNTGMSGAITTAKTYGDVLLIQQMPSPGLTGGQQTTLATYLNPLMNLAQTNGCGILDFSNRWTNATTAQGLGYYAGSALNPNATGHGDIARAVFNVVSRN